MSIQSAPKRANSGDRGDSTEMSGGNKRQKGDKHEAVLRTVVRKPRDERTTGEAGKLDEPRNFIVVGESEAKVAAYLGYTNTADLRRFVSSHHFLIYFLRYAGQWSKNMHVKEGFEQIRDHFLNDDQGAFPTHRSSIAKHFVENLPKYKPSDGTRRSKCFAHILIIMVHAFNEMADEAMVVPHLQDAMVERLKAYRPEICLNVPDMKGQMVKRPKFKTHFEETALEQYNRARNLLKYFATCVCTRASYQLKFEHRDWQVGMIIDESYIPTWMREVPGVENEASDGEDEASDGEDGASDVDDEWQTTTDGTPDAKDDTTSNSSDAVADNVDQDDSDVPDAAADDEDVADALANSSDAVADEVHQDDSGNSDAAADDGEVAGDTSDNSDAAADDAREYLSDRLHAMTDDEDDAEDLSDNSDAVVEDVDENLSDDLRAILEETAEDVSTSSEAADVAAERIDEVRSNTSAVATEEALPALPIMVFLKRKGGREQDRKALRAHLAANEDIELPSSVQIATGDPRRQTKAQFLASLERQLDCAESKFQLATARFVIKPTNRKYEILDFNLFTCDWEVLRSQLRKAFKAGGMGKGKKLNVNVRLRPIKGELRG